MSEPNLHVFQQKEKAGTPSRKALTLWLKLSSCEAVVPNAPIRNNIITAEG